MIAHLMLPYTWIDCVDSNNCGQYFHLPETEENLNKYPKEWVSLLLGNCIFTETEIYFFDKDNVPHNETGPAYLHADGTEQWFQGGIRHRVDGPAVRKNDGVFIFWKKDEWYYDDIVLPANIRQEWWVNGKLHCVDGPAIVTAQGTYQWIRDGKLHRETGPAVKREDGTVEWFLDNQLHREGGPAREWGHGTVEWFIEGERHREDGPAVTYADGTEEWWIKGVKQEQSTK